ncbi:MAG: energy-coupling factor transporter transmembrane component T [Actinomycetota bacterium]
MIGAAEVPQDRFRLDPRTKLALLILMNVVVYSFGGPLFIVLGVALGACLTLAAGRFRAVFVFAAIYALLFAVDAVIVVAPAALVEAWRSFSLSFFVALPTAIYALLLVTTTTMSELAAAMQKLRLPAAAMIPLLVFVRFVPTVVADFRAITTAMRLRGATGRGNPLKAMEYVYVPLLLGMVRTGDQLTVAALTRGLGRFPTRTYINEPRFRVVDVVALAAMGALVVASQIAARSA